jgi:hypothetical protein
MNEENGGWAIASGFSQNKQQLVDMAYRNGKQLLPRPEATSQHTNQDLNITLFDTVTRYGVL